MASAQDGSCSMLSTVAARSANHNVDEPEPHSSTRAPGRPTRWAATTSAASKVHQGTLRRAISSRS